MPSEQQQPIDLTPGEEVLEFGADQPSRRRWGGGLGRGLAADRRVPPLAAGLAGVAFFTSLISEWQVTTVERGLFRGEVGDMVMPTEATDLGALGAGYLVGVFLLATTVVLTMFGPVAGRAYARLTGLSVGGTVLALLLALALSLGEQSRTISQLYTLELDDDDITLGYGRGLWCALAGVLLVLAALHLAGRHQPEAAAPGSPAAVEPDAAWSWRRPDAYEEPDEHAPLELTVSPAKPFTPDADGRDEPGGGRAGISG